MDSEVMTLREVCEYLRVHPSTIYRMLKRGTFPAMKLGSDYRFRRDLIDEWRDARTVKVK
jgi:excisionase family DNA binding protein